MAIERTNGWWEDYRGLLPTSFLDLSEEDHVTVRVMPFDLDGFSGASSTMTYVGGPVPKLDTVVRDALHVGVHRFRGSAQHLSNELS